MYLINEICEDVRGILEVIVTFGPGNLMKRGTMHDILTFLSLNNKKSCQDRQILHFLLLIEYSSQRNFIELKLFELQHVKGKTTETLQKYILVC